ncbi:MAG: hypothetical protein NTZ12_04635 [Candidatus Aminicenantes bacterium]|nr:hypothetical protein [Candidatus Aminicenantes bacterium]
MLIHIPNSAFLNNIECFLSKLNINDPDIIEVTFNEKWTAVHPLVLSMTTAILLSGKLRNTSIINKCPAARSTPYLQRMGLFNNLSTIPQTHITEHESSGRFIPLTQLKNSNDLTKFITDIVPLLHASPTQVRPIQYVISELVRNVIEHAQSPIGAIVCAQYFKKSGRISIGVADAGIGIRQSMFYFYPTSNDLEAIRLALRPGITGTTSKYGGTEENGGAGLFFTKSIAKVGRNHFVIISGNALYKLRHDPLLQETVFLYADPFQDIHTKSSDIPIWQGTAVGIDINIDSHQNFEELLKLIQKAYRLNVNDVIKRKYKKARFI